MERLLEISSERDSYGAGAVKEFVERVKDAKINLLTQNQAFYHRECYADYANKEKLDRAKKRYQDATEFGSSSMTNRKAGRPSLSKSRLQSCSQPWKFEGSFSNFTVPKALSTLLKWILIGPSVELSETSENTELNKMISVISQVLMQAVKTKRQVQYNPKDDSDGSAYNTKETTLSVGLGLFLNQRTRSKEIVDMLSTLKLSCTYKESIAKEVTEQMENNNSVYVPSPISPNKLIRQTAEASYMELLK